MAISTTGRVVKAKSKAELKRVGGRQMDQQALDYNHFRILFADGSDRHFLFTDSQIEKALKSGENIDSDTHKTTWVKEVWYEGVMDVSIQDFKRIIEKYSLPKNAKTFNHIRIDIGGEEKHMIFTDSSIRNAIKRAKDKGGKLPKVSWLEESFFKGTVNAQGKEQETESKIKREEVKSSETELERIA